MKEIINIIKYDYIQRSRSYGFLITLCISMAIAYSFVPAPSANYTTVQIGSYVGYYNAAWFGYVTAIMTSIFLFFGGFFLVHGSIDKDMGLELGDLIAASPISNFTYLLAKSVCNALILLSIAGLVFLLSIILFFLYNDGFPFELIQFIKPYLIVAAPSIIFVSVLAVILEVALPRYVIFQRIIFFMLFILFLQNQFFDAFSFSDVFGTDMVLDHMTDSVNAITSSEDNGTNIGFVIKQDKEVSKFLFDGVSFSSLFVAGRLFWAIIPFVLLFTVSFFFHRFSLKKKFNSKVDKGAGPAKGANAILVGKLPSISADHSVMPLVKLEVLMLLRLNSKWINLLTLIGMGLLIFLPLNIAHAMVLPVLWFINVLKWSNLVSKEYRYGVDQIISASIQPVRRILFAQCIAGAGLSIVIAAPLIIRFGIGLNYIAIMSIILGGIILILSSVLLGLASKSQKLFEVLFFMVTYANLNQIKFFDYYGAMNSTYIYLNGLFFIALSIMLFIVFIKQYRMKIT